MPIVNLAAAQARSQVVGITTSPVDSIGLGTDNAAEALTFRQLGTGGATSTWKNTGGSAILTSSEADDDETTTNPWWQLEDTWDDTEFNGNVVFEIGTSRGTLSGENPGTEDGKLYSRKRVGGATGLGKTSDYSLVARVKMTYPSS